VGLEFYHEQIVVRECMVLVLHVLIGLYGDNCVPFINILLKLQREFQCFTVQFFNFTK